MGDLHEGRTNDPVGTVVVVCCVVVVFGVCFVVFGVCFVVFVGVGGAVVFASVCPRAC
jgi:hypothetical protein